MYTYVRSDAINYFDITGLLSVNVSGYYGVGGGFSFGQNPDGSPFVSVEMGAGYGAGASFDPSGTSPSWGNDSGNGTFGSVCGFIGAGGNIGPVGAGIGIESGFSATPDGDELFSSGWQPSATVESEKDGIGFSFSGGVRATIGQ